MLYSPYSLQLTPILSQVSSYQFLVSSGRKNTNEQSSKQQFVFSVNLDDSTLFL